MLSQRGAKNAASQDIPWRFAPGGNNRYDPDTNPDGVISFATAENSLMHDELHEFVQSHVSIPKFAYTYRFSTAGGPRFPVAMAALMNKYFKPFLPVQATDVMTTSALTAMHELIGYSLGDPGDGILVSRPVYGRFELDFGNTSGLHMVYADMDGIDPFSPEAVSKYQEALDRSARNGVHVKAILIVNPHNPLGRTYPVETLRALMAFCEHNKIHFISDEVYAFTTFDDSFVSVLSIDSKGLIDDNRLHVLYGMSKDFAAAGLRIGNLITRSSTLKKAIASNIRFHGASGPSIAIGTAILENHAFIESFMKLSRERLQDTRKYVMGILDEAGIKYESRATAGFFLFIDLSPWLETVSSHNRHRAHNAEFALAQKLLDAGVGLHPAEEHAESPGQFRMVFSHPRSILSEGLARLITALQNIDHYRSGMSDK